MSILNIRLPVHCYKLIIIAMLSHLLISCTTVLPKYELTLDKLNQTNTKSGLKITVRPLFEHDESEKYFGKNLLSDKIIAVFIKIENMNSSSHYMVDKNKIKLTTQVSKDNVILNNNRGASIANEYAYAYSGMLAQMAINESREEYVFRSNEYRTRTISPNGNAEGFLYYNYSGDLNDLGDIVLQIQAVNPIDSTTVKFNFKIQ